jgi:uncharacterized protein
VAALSGQPAPWVTPADVGMPSDIGIIDTMMGVRPLDGRENARPRSKILPPPPPSPVGTSIGYMFHDELPAVGGPEGADLLLPEMDRYGIERAVLMHTTPEDPVSLAAIEAHPDRFTGQFTVSPMLGYDALREIHFMVEHHPITSLEHGAAFGPHPIPVNDKRMYPIYAKCIELDLPIFMYVGVPGPRVAFAPQYVGLLDEVCAYFPELKIVMRHGAEPWTDLAVKLMLKWPNLYFSTSGFAPKYYPSEIIEYANTRGAEKIIYSGYFPIGLPLSRTFAELPQVPFRAHVWPLFLRENARRVLNLP